MKKRIRKHTGEAAAVLFTLLFLCGNWGNCQKVFGADVEKTELCDGTEIAELCDGEKHLQEEMNIDGQQEEKDKEYTEEWKEVGEENREEDTEKEEEIQNPLMLSLSGEPVLKAGEAAVYEVALKNAGEVGEENREEDTEKEEEIQNPLMLSLSGEPVLKAGEAAVYEVALKNAGEEKLSDLILTAEFSCPKVTWQWQEAPGLDMQEERSVLSVLEPGQETLLFLTAQLQPEQKEPLTCTVTASMEGGFSSEGAERTSYLYSYGFYGRWIFFGRRMRIRNRTFESRFFSRENCRPFGCCGAERTSYLYSYGFYGRWIFFGRRMRIRNRTFESRFFSRENCRPFGCCGWGGNFL